MHILPDCHAFCGQKAKQAGAKIAPAGEAGKQSSFPADALGEIPADLGSKDFFIEVNILGLAFDFEQVLDIAKNEREIQPFLKEHLNLVRNAFNPSWNFVRCIPEFKLGDMFVADFLILSADSGSWNVSLIEVESHKARLYLKDGTPSKTLRIAERQVDDWKIWIGKNQSYLRSKLSSIFRDLKTPSQCSRADLHTTAETEILDNRTCIRFNYHILIGRRCTLTPEEQERRYINEERGVKIVTYDRLLNIAKKIDESEIK